MRALFISIATLSALCAACGSGSNCNGPYDGAWVGTTIADRLVVGADAASITPAPPAACPTGPMPRRSPRKARCGW